MTKPVHKQLTQSPGMCSGWSASVNAAAATYLHHYVSIMVDDLVQDQVQYMLRVELDPAGPFGYDHEVVLERIKAPAW